MRQIFTYMLVRNLRHINIGSIFVKKPKIDKPTCNTNLEINDHKHILYYSLCL